jgi:hypothetical protein
MTSRERKDAAETIRSFLDGRSGPLEWDDFTSLQTKDLDYQMIRNFCANSDLLYPPEEKGGWCGKEGKARLLELAALLDSRAPFNAIRGFMDEERRRAAEDPDGDEGSDSLRMERGRNSPDRLGNATLSLPVFGICLIFVTAMIPPLSRIGPQIGCAVVFLSVPFAGVVAILSWTKSRHRAWTAIAGLGLAVLFSWQLWKHPVHL